MTIVPFVTIVLVVSSRTLAQADDPSWNGPLPAGENRESVECVRLPSLSSAREDAARNSVWDTVSEPKPVDLSGVLPPVSPAARVASRPSTSKRPSSPATSSPRIARQSHERSQPETRDVSIMKETSFQSARPDYSQLIERNNRALERSSVALPTVVTDWSKSGSSLAAAAQRADERVRQAMSLADKGAVYAARDEFVAALQTIAQALDSHYYTQAHSESLTEGLLAMHEAGDYLPPTGSATMTVNVTSVAASHRSRALEGFELQQLDAITAARLHFAYAQRQIAAALGGSPVASKSLYGLGKFCMLRAEQSPASAQANNSRAMAFHQAALMVEPSNPMAGNELGVLLARQGRLTEARDVLQRSVAVHPSPESWRNLTTVFERLGEYGEAQRSRVALQNTAAMVNNSNPGVVTSTSGTSVHWVDRSTFERGSLPGEPIPPPRPVPQGNGNYTLRPMSSPPWMR